MIPVNYGKVENEEDLFYKPGHLVEFIARGADFEPPDIGRRAAPRGQTTRSIPGILAIGQFTRPIF